MMMYVSGTKVLADPAPGLSCDISSSLLHSGCWRRPHSPGDLSSALSISLPSCRRCRLCSWHFFSISDGFLEPPRGSYHGQGPTEATLGELLGGSTGSLPQVLCSSSAGEAAKVTLGMSLGGQGVEVTTETLRSLNRAGCPIARPSPCFVRDMSPSVALQALPLEPAAPCDSPRGRWPQPRSGVEEGEDVGAWERGHVRQRGKEAKWGSGEEATQRWEKGAVG